MKALLSKFASKLFGCFFLVLLGTHAVFGQADLQLLSVEFTPSVVKAGGTITEVSWFLLNSGPQTLARPTFNFDIFLSRNAIVGDADDLKIDAVAIPNPSVNWPAGSGAQQKVFEIAVPADAFGDYFIVVRGNPVGTDPNLVNNSTRSLNSIRVVAPPIITAQPRGQSVSEGQTAKFSVIAEAIGPLSYQWQRNNLPLVDQTNANLTILNVRSGDAGGYSVTVSNLAGVVASRDAVLTVVPADLAFRLINPAKAGNTFTVTVPTFTNRTYVLEYKDALTNRVWTATAALSGNGANRTLLDGNATDRQRYYRVTVANQIAQGFYVGDGYSLLGGEKQLYRSSAVLVQVKSGQAVDTISSQLTANGSSLAGYKPDLRLAENTLLFRSPESVTLEKYEENLKATALNQFISSASFVFVDDASGLLLFPTDEIILRLKPGVDSQIYFGAAQKNFRKVRGTIDQFVLKMPGTPTRGILEAVTQHASDPRVAWAEPHFLLEGVLSFVPNDPLFPSQWHLDNKGSAGALSNADVNAPEAWDLSTGKDVVIAVLDTGVDLSHPDLSSNIATNAGEIPGNGIDDDKNGYIDDIHGWDFLGILQDLGGGFFRPFPNNDPNPKVPADTHGTLVSGVAVASGGNGIGVAGTAFRSTLLPIRIGQQIPNSSKMLSGAEVLASAIYYAAGLDENGAQRWRGADIVNMSLGAGQTLIVDTALEIASQHGRSGRGCVIFAATGNAAPITIPIGYPANHPAVVAVGASTDRDTRATYSQYGSSLSFLAPGGDGRNTPTSLIHTTARRDSGNGYDYNAGTSFGSPLAAGVGALILSANPNLRPDEVRQIMRETCDKIGGVTYDANRFHPEYGYGRVNAFEAVKKAISLRGGGNQPPIVVITKPANRATFTTPASIAIEATASDPDPGGRVVSIEFFDGTTSLGQDTSDPYSITATLGVGSHTLTAKATDDKGASKTSEPVTVSVIRDTPPSISDINDQSTDEDKSTASISFTIADDRTPVSSLNLTFSSSNRALVPESNITLGGSGANRTITVQPVLNEFGKTTITVTVADEAKQTASDSFVLTVNPVNDLPTLNSISDFTITAGTSQEISLSGISYGPANENQSITLKVESGDRTLIPDPTVSYASPNALGKLTITPASNRTGKATITVTVQDSGGTANGGQDTITRAFNVTVTDSTQPQITHQGPAEYVSGGTVQITNRFAWTGTLLTLLWRPQLPTGWQLKSAEPIGVGSPVMSPNGTAIVWLENPLPQSPIQMRYTVQVPATATGTQTIRGEVEYQLQGASDPNFQKAFAAPNPLELRSRPTIENTPPTISAISDQTIKINTSTAVLLFTVNDAETPATSLKVEPSSSNQSLVPNSGIVLGGSGTSRVVTITPTANQTGSTRITLTVRNTEGLAATSAFQVTVIDGPTDRIQGRIVAWGDNSYRAVADAPTVLGDVVAMAAGYEHALALRADGTVVGWGWNFYSQTNIPSGLNNVVAIAAGGLHSLALKADGTVVAWGGNLHGASTVPAGLNTVVAIAAQDYTSLALRADGTVVAWGLNDYGQINVPSGLNDVEQIAAGHVHNLALRADGTVVGWGWNFFGQTTTPSGLNNATAIAAGMYHNLALRRDGTVVAWGGGPVDYGQTSVPAGLKNVVAIGAGEYDSLALLADGSVVVWGRNDYGQANLPIGLSKVVKIAAGYRFCLALVGSNVPTIAVQPQNQTVIAGNNVTFGVSASGAIPLVYQWRKDGVALADGGRISGARTSTLALTGALLADSGNYTVVVTNTYGIVTSSVATLTVVPRQTAGGGIPGRIVAWGDNSYRAVADAPTALGNVVAVAAGYEHALALRADGTVVGWGWNYYFQTNIPSGLNNVVALAAGGLHSLALKADGTVVAWGGNLHGASTVPAGLNKVVAIAAHDYTSMALRADGTVVAWGLNDYGQMDVPAGLNSVVAIAAGHVHNLALQANGTVVGWGWNFFGQTTIPSSLPNAMAIAAGMYHNLALRKDGTVVAWGGGPVDYGQTSVPAGLNNVVAIAAGEYDSMALQADGSVVVWGRNDYGQQNLPIGLKNVVKIAAGERFCLALLGNEIPTNQ